MPLLSWLQGMRFSVSSSSSSVSSSSSAEREVWQHHGILTRARSSYISCTELDEHSLSFTVPLPMVLSFYKEDGTKLK